MEREQINESLQFLPLDELTELCRIIEGNSRVERLRKPTLQTMLLPVTDPITGGSFYCGEILVTSAITRVNGHNGWSMVLDDNPELADTIALIDAAFAADLYHTEIAALVASGSLRKSTLDADERMKTEATRVAFDLL